MRPRCSAIQPVPWACSPRPTRHSAAASGFQRGLERILDAHGAPVAILPLAMRCEYYENQRPEALFLFDRVLTAGPGAFPQAGWLEQRVAALLEEAGRAAVERRPGRVLLEAGCSWGSAAAAGQQA
jgi:hypothetical protein